MPRKRLHILIVGIIIWVGIQGDVWQIKNVRRRARRGMENII
jgi:hypothetical protein